MKFVQYIGIFVLLASSCLWWSCGDTHEQKATTSSVPSVEATDISSLKVHTAGEALVLGWKQDESLKTFIQDPVLVISTSLGTSAISQTITDNPLHEFSIPAWIANSGGKVYWEVMDQEQSADQGSFEIIANLQNRPTPETYMGPPTLEAGADESAMIVILPTDNYDNLLPDQTTLDLSEWFESQTNLYPLQVTNRFAWKRISNRQQSGRILMGITVGDGRTKEQRLDILPGSATAFQLEAQRVHPYADGNQIVKLKTSVIQDTWDNIVADGTAVRFQITSDAGTYLEAIGTSMDGVASVQLEHPSTAQTWSVIASVGQEILTEPMSLYFESILEEIPFRLENRTLTIGPLTSYLQQWIPEGTLVTITSASGRIETAASHNGKVAFELQSTQWPSGSYDIRITCLGKTKQTTLNLP